MATQDRNTLKNYFNTSDRPTEQEFANLIDSIVNIEEDKTDLASAIDVNEDASFITPKSAKKLIDSYAIRKVNSVSPDANGNVQVTNITGSAGSITGNIPKSQAARLQADLDAKLNDNMPVKIFTTLTDLEGFSYFNIILVRSLLHKELQN